MLGYAEITSNPTVVTAVGAANRVDVTGLTITVTVGSRPIMVMGSFGTAFNDDASGRGGGIAIVETTTVMSQSSGYSIAANALFPLTTYAVLTGSRQPSAGAHTYKIMAWAVVSGNLTLVAATGQRAFIMAVEL